MADNDSDLGCGALVIFAGLAIGIGGWLITGQSWVFLIGLAIGGIGWLMIERNDPGGHRRKAAEEAAFEHGLEADAGGFAAPLVLRQYDNTDDGNRLFQREGEIFMAHGYEPSGPSAEGGHIHAGRLLLTGGLSVLAGRNGIRSKGKITVTFQKRPVAEPSADVGGQLRELAALRDEGILTDEEFQAEKAKLLR